MKPTLPVFLLVLLFACQAAFTAEPASTPPKQELRTDGPGHTEIIRDREIAKVDGEPILVDLAYPKVAPAAPMPVLVCVHGGGWSGGDKGGALRLDVATRGYFVLSVGYRLAGPSHWPGLIQDCKLAIRWIRAHAAELHIDPDRIGVFGHSAGGHLVACLGTMGEVPGLDVGEFPGVSSRVQAVVDYAGPTDLNIYFAGKDGPKDKILSPAWREHPEIVGQASPLNFVKAGLPPFFIAHGDKDTLVPIEQAEKMMAALKAAGVPVEYVIVKNGGHGLGGEKEPDATPTRAELTERMLAFLDSVLKK